MNTQDDSIDTVEEDEENPNKNCLEGMQCPKCRSFGPFQIEITTIMMVDDEGVDEQCGDNEWNDESYCQCTDCDNSGTVATFSGQEAAPVKPSLEMINAELLQALKALVGEIDLSKLSVRKDFSLLNAHACATKTVAKAEGK